ncbi:hypothetical protein Hanom_Chr09g00796721 [Helianthus anomalus]
MLIGLDICDICWSYMDCEFELEVSEPLVVVIYTSFGCLEQLVSTSSYTRPSYLHRLRRSLLESQFLMFFSKDFSNKSFHSLFIF